VNRIRIGKQNPVYRIGLDIPKESIVPETVWYWYRRRREMETINESEEATSSEELTQLIQQIQEELIVEDKRHFDTLAYFKNRIKEEEEKHTRQQRLLETRLLQAITTVEGSITDGDYWLNNTKIPKKEQPRKLTKEEKTLIRSRVKKAYSVSKKK